MLGNWVRNQRRQFKHFFPFHSSLSSNVLPGATAVQDSTRARNVVCSLPEVCTSNSPEHKSGEISSGDTALTEFTLQTGNAAPCKEEVAKVSREHHRLALLF